MSYLNVDDGIMEHPKIAPLSAHAKLLHFAGLVYCARNLTDGLIEGKAVKTVVIQADAQRRHLLELSTAGVWIQTPTGYRIHDYLDHNKSKEKILAERKAKADRQARWRDNRNNNGQYVDTPVDRLQDAQQDHLGDTAQARHRPLLSSPLPLKVTTLLLSEEPRPQGPHEKLLALAWNEEDRDKLRRAAQGLPESDLINALEAAHGPKVTNRLAAALARLKQRRAASIPAREPSALDAFRTSPVAQQVSESLEMSRCRLCGLSAGRHVSGCELSENVA